MSLYLYYHDSQGYSCNIPKTPCAGNHYELIDVDNIREYDWDVRQAAAADVEQEDCQDWSDHVESNGGVSRWVEYDPTDPVHIAHTGYEDQRPEHIEYLAEQKRLQKLAQQKWNENRLVEIGKEIRALELERMELEDATV